MMKPGKTLIVPWFMWVIPGIYKGEVKSWRQTQSHKPDENTKWEL